MTLGSQPCSEPVFLLGKDFKGEFHFQINFSKERFCFCFVMFCWVFGFLFIFFFLQLSNWKYFLPLWCIRPIYCLWANLLEAGVWKITLSAFYLVKSSKCFLKVSVSLKWSMRSIRHSSPWVSHLAFLIYPGGGPCLHPFSSENWFWDGTHPSTAH